MTILVTCKEISKQGGTKILEKNNMEDDGVNQVQEF